MRMLYGERADALKLAADRHLAGLLDVPKLVAGLDAPAFFAPGTDDAAMVRRAARAGLETRALSFYAIDRPAPPGLVLGFASISADDIEAGVVALARALVTA
jgi:GntR family transcriptional regulator/MocR family aminotransferase